jgi:hypothetical protein
MYENKKSKVISYIFGAMFFLAFTGIILYSVDPTNASIFIFALLYLFLAGFIFCFFTVIILILRGLFHKDLRSERIARRESLLLAVLVVGSLILASRGLLFWWTAMIFALALVLIEGFFLIA